MFFPPKNKSMTFDSCLKETPMFDDFFSKKIPLAIIGALLLQASTAIWWAATKDSDDRFQQQRIDRVEQSMSRTQDAQTEIVERLARIEERVNAEASSLDRIEQHLGAFRK
jgi:hypothetical protein